LAVEDLQGNAAQVFAQMAAHAVARAGAVAVVVVILRTPAKDAGEDEQRGECEQPEDGSAVVARGQRQADGDEQGNAEPVG
jgi:hypothetical protein